MCARVKDDDLVADHDVIISTPFGIDHVYLPRQPVEVDAVRNAGSDPHRDVKPYRRHLMLSDDGVDLCALLGRELGGARCRTLTGGGAVAFFGRALGRGVRRSIFSIVWLFICFLSDAASSATLAQSFRALCAGWILGPAQSSRARFSRPGHSAEPPERSRCLITLRGLRRDGANTKQHYCRRGR